MQISQESVDAMRWISFGTYWWVSMVCKRVSFGSIQLLLAGRKSRLHNDFVYICFLNHFLTLFLSQKHTLIQYQNAMWYNQCATIYINQKYIYQSFIFKYKTTISYTLSWWTVSCFTVLMNIAFKINYVIFKSCIQYTILKNF